MMKSLRGGDAARGCVAALILALTAIPSAGPGRTAEPIKIGFGMALTGGLAANGKSALLAMKIWEEDTNANGGLLERPVRLIYYDDQSNPAVVPGLFTKLLEVDKVDLVVGDYGTNLLAPAMPVIISHNMTFIGLFGLAVNSEFNYPKYFSTFPTGPDPKTGFSKGFFHVAMAQNPKPKTIAIAAADAEFARNAADGARLNAKAAGLQIVYDRTYPPSTVDYTPIVRAIQATNPDILYVGSYPLDSVGMVRAIKEVGLNVKLCCGGMVGLQYTAFKTQLGSLLNGIVNYDVWQPAPTMMFPGNRGFPEEISGTRGCRGRRSARLLPPAFRLCAAPDIGRGRASHQEPRSEQTRGLYPRPHYQDRGRRLEIRQGRRVGGAPSAANSISAREGQRR